MKFPWKKREEEAHEKSLEAQKQLREVEARWPQIRKTVENAKFHREANHWSADITAIFSGRGK